MNIVFFGSTEDSVSVLKQLHAVYPVSAVVTQKPKPVGRNKIVTPTPVEVWGKKQSIPVLTFDQDEEKQWKFKDDQAVINSVSTFHPDLVVTACFGERIPSALLSQTKFGGVNVHPSILPRWRGAYPVPWAIIAGDAQIGVTVSTITKNFDDGKILNQKKIPLTPHDDPDTLRKTLFTMGAALLVQTLPEYLSGKNKGVDQKKEDVTIARRLDRNDGYIPWELLDSAMKGIDIKREQRQGLLQDIQQPLPDAVTTLSRALSPWPGIWTTIIIHGESKRVKILKGHIQNNAFIPQDVQLEGKTPVSWETFTKAYL